MGDDAILAFRNPPLMNLFASYSEAQRIRMCGSSPRSNSPPAIAAAPISMLDEDMFPWVLSSFSSRASDFDRPCPVYLAAPNEHLPYWKPIGARPSRDIQSVGGTRKLHASTIIGGVWYPVEQGARRGGPRKSPRQPQPALRWLLHGHWGGYAPHTHTHNQKPALGAYWSGRAMRPSSELGAGLPREAAVLGVSFMEVVM